VRRLFDFRVDIGRRGIIPAARGTGGSVAEDGANDSRPFTVEAV
jgi:hypothetical protein